MEKPRQCCCSRPETENDNFPQKQERTVLWGGATLIGLVLWGLIYSQLLPFSERLVAFFPWGEGGRLKEAAAFFLYDAPKVLLLLALIVFLMGVLRSFFSPERTRALLAGRREGVGNVAAACLGILTPFCSCSAVPLFVGFLSAGVPLGVTFSFLIAAPMVNEVALGLLFGLVGWKIALAYLGFGLGLAISAGWLMGRMGLEKHLEKWVQEARAVEPLGSDRRRLNLPERIREGLSAVREIVGKVWVWMLLGIAAGAFIHGYVPSDLLATIMGKDVWWSVPAAVLLGVPVYANAAGIIPIVEALLGKGAALGTVLAFMMAVTALSLPEAIILRRVLTFRLLAVYFGIVAGGILAVGFLFNAFF